MSVVEAASPHLRDFLRVKDEDAGAAIGGRRPEVPRFIFGTVLTLEKQPSPVHSGAVSAPPASRTLLDIIRDEEPNGCPYKRAVGQGQHHGKDRKSWKSFKDRLRLRRPGSPGISTSPVPSPEFPGRKSCRSPESRHGSARFDCGGPAGPSLTENSVAMEDGDSSPSSRPVRQRSSTRFGTLVPISLEPAAQSRDSPEQSPTPQISRHNSARYASQLTQSPRDRTSSSISREGSAAAAVPAEDSLRDSTRRLSVALAEERQQEAGGGGEEQPVRMSLMDLLEETDRQMGFEGTRYTVGEEEEGEDLAEEVEAGGHGGVSGGGDGGVERNCCICMVRHRGAAFIPCGHTFCRLCSRELWVSRGNCPLCNNYIVEILDIF